MERERKGGVDREEEGIGGRVRNGMERLANGEGKGGVGGREMEGRG